MGIFAAIFTLVQLALALYLHHRFIRSNRALARRARLGWSALLLAAFGMILGSFYLRFRVALPLRSPAVQAYHWLVFSLMGFLAILVIYSLGADLARALVAATRRLARNRRQGSVDSSRRGFILAASAGSAAIGIGQAVSGPQVKRVEVPLAGLPEGLRGLKIVQLSDLHVGPTITRDYVQKVVDQVNELKPDLIALTGDFVDGSVSQLRDDVAPLAGLRAKHGVFYCTGNHEFYSGVEPWMEEFRRLGFRVLDNRHEVVHAGTSSIAVAGVHDISSPKRFPGYESDPQRAIAGAPRTDLRILLAHQPKSVFEAAKAGYDLQLSGHTHAGQFFPFSLFVHFAHPYVSGLHRHDERLWIYVNQATGYWGPPIRLGIPAEITLLELVLRIEEGARH